MIAKVWDNVAAEADAEERSLNAAPDARGEGAPPEIAQLSQRVTAQIAAGEVIERPASIVKELIENALDAGARRIEVELEEAGLGLIRVSDDGRGMTAKQLPLAFARHATSKLRRAEDLETIRSFGFRGEALPSIAAVAEVDCVSRAAGEDAGARLLSRAGRSGAVQPAGAPPGTTIAARELFGRQPARRKFLAGPRAERAAVARVCGDALLSGALGVPLGSPGGLALRLVIDGRTLLESPAMGPGDPEAALRAAFAAIWGAEAAAGALPLHGMRDVLQEADEADGGASDVASPVAGEAIRVRGLAASPEHHRGRRGEVRLFVNGRPVESRRLRYAIGQAYADLLPARRFPIVACFLELPPRLVDVNVHPTKAEVKLRDEGAAFGLIQQSVRAALLGLEPPRADGAQSIGRATAGGQPDRGRGETPLPDYLRRRPVLPLAQSVVGRGLNEEVAAEIRVFEPRPRPVFDLARGRPRSSVAREAQTPPARGTVADDPLGPPEQSRLPGLPLLRLVGQLRSAYVVAEGPAGLVLVDQHAAHERVLYEQFLARSLAGSAADASEADGAQTEGRQELLDPPLIELTPSAAAAWDSHAASLLGAGFVCEEFGDRVLRLRAVPAALGERDARATLQAVLDELAGEERVVLQNDPALASAACHAAVRAGKSLSLEEMRALLRDLESCENPHTCPHGRPVMVQFELAELERRFGR